MSAISLGQIVGIHPETGKVNVLTAPAEHETGWIPVLGPTIPGLQNAECIVIPSHGVYGQGVAIPVTLPAACLGTIESLSPLKVTGIECLTIVELVSEDVGKQALIIPVYGSSKYVLTGVIKS